MPPTFTIHTDPHAPKAPVYRRRLTPELRAMKPTQYADLPLPTANCLQQYGRAQGWQTTRLTQPDGLIRVWRLS